MCSILQAIIGTYHFITEIFYFPLILQILFTAFKRNLRKRSLIKKAPPKFGVNI